MNNFILINKLQNGQFANITNIIGKFNHTHYLRELGLTNGAKIEMVKNDGKICIIRIDNNRIILRLNNSCQILVKQI